MSKNRMLFENRVRFYFTLSIVKVFRALKCRSVLFYVRKQLTRFFENGRLRSPLRWCDLFERLRTTESIVKLTSELLHSSRTPSGECLLRAVAHFASGYFNRQTSTRRPIVCLKRRRFGRRNCSAIDAINCCVFFLLSVSSCQRVKYQTGFFAAIKLKGGNRDDRKKLDYPVSLWMRARYELVLFIVTVYGNVLRRVNETNVICNGLNCGLSFSR